MNMHLWRSLWRAHIFDKVYGLTRRQNRRQRVVQDYDQQCDQMFVNKPAQMVQILPKLPAPAKNLSCFCEKIASFLHFML